MIEAIRVLSAVPFERGHGGELTAQVRRGLNIDLAALGYVADATLLSALGSLPPERFAQVRHELIEALCTIIGADAPATPLFAGFPYSLPDDLERMRLWLRGRLHTMFGIRAEGAELLPCGHVAVPADLVAAGIQGCPVCGTLHSGLVRDRARPAPLDKVLPLASLGYLGAEELAAQASDMLVRPSSLSLDERALVRTADRALLRMPAAPFRETVPLLVELFPAEQALPHVRTATDVLRLAAGLSAPDADLSLASPPRFHLTTGQRRMLLRLLDRIPSPIEDMLRHREMWLRLGEQLRPFHPRNRRAAPRAAEAFELLRNAPNVPTFHRAVEEAMRARRIDSATIRLLATRPGEFLRRLDHMLRVANDREPVLEALPGMLASATTKLLFEIDAHLRSRDRVSHRLFRPKGATNKLYFIANRREPIHAEDLVRVRAMIAAEIDRRLRRLPPIGRVCLLPELAKVPAPYNRRGDSATSSSLPKGGRVPFTGDVIRLFVHWTGLIDVDLSITLWDEDLGSRGHVAFTNLAHFGCLHSGDVQSAPDGASEYIDFKVPLLRTYGVRYVAASMISFTSQPFSAFPCFAGFMERSDVGSGELYEPAAVRHRFELDQPGRSAVPLIFDLKTREVIFADLATSGGGQQAVLGQVTKQQVILQSVLSMTDRLPTLMDLAAAHVAARGTMASREEADLVLGLADMERILREFGYE